MVFDDENFSVEECKELLASRGLFDANVIAVLHKVLENKEAESFVLKMTKQLAESKNVFVLVEEKLSGGADPKFKKYANKIWLLKQGATSKSSHQK